MSDRRHVVVLDDSDFALFRGPGGMSYLDRRHNEVTLVIAPDAALGATPDEYDRVIRANPHDIEAVLALTHDLEEGPPVNKILGLSEFTSESAAELRQTLGVPGYSPSQNHVLRDKTIMKRHFQRVGVKVPEFASIRRPAEAADLLHQHGRIVIKPRALASSRGYHEITSQHQLSILDKQGLPRDIEWEAEQFIEGALHHIDSVVDHGTSIASTVSRYLDRDTQVTLGGQLRSLEVAPGPVKEALTEVNSRILSAIPWFSGVTHLEVFLEPDDTVVLCEIAGRVGGGGIIPSFMYRFGIDLRLAALSAQLDGWVPAVDPSAPGARDLTGWTIIYAPTAGPLRAPGPLPDADWLLAFDMKRRPGSTVGAPQDSSDGIAVVSVAGHDERAVAARLTTVADAVTAPMQTGRP